jgi:hypothetical protein
MRALLVVGFCVACSASARAQGAQSAQPGTFAGTVARDTVGDAIAGAEVSIPDLNLTTLTNARGEFELSGVPSGRHAITVRAIGYQFLVDTIAVAAGQGIDADIVLTRTPVDLAPVKTTERAVEKRLPIGLQEMEERRKIHMGGHFVTDSMLRANDEKKLTFFFLGMNVHQVLGKGTQVYLANGRGNPLHPGAPCYISIYVDGAVYYSSGQGEPPDFNALWANDYSGIEFYPSGSTTPAEYNGTTTADCGTMLLWTRRTP